MSVTNEGPLPEGDWNSPSTEMNDAVRKANDEIQSLIARVQRLITQRNNQLDVIKDVRAELDESRGRNCELQKRVRELEGQVERLRVGNDPDRSTRGIMRTQAYLAIDSERDYQDSRQVELDWSTHHSVGAWLTILQVYVSKAQAAWCSESGHEGGLEGVRKVAGLAVACMEEHGAPKREAPAWAPR